GRPRLEAVETDIEDAASAEAALAGAWGAVNAVSLYVETGDRTFQRIHVEAAGNLARLAGEAGVARLVHISGIGADPASHSPYISARGRGEAAVRAAFPAAIVVRPAVMFGPDDSFLTTLVGLTRRLPVYPLFGRGETRLQPAYVGDVGEAVARIMALADPAGTYELAGPDTFTYAGLVRHVARATGARTRPVPLPFAAWKALGFAAEFLPSPPVTRNQVELMQFDNVATPGMPGLADLGIAATPIGAVLAELGEAQGSRTGS
ncbi:MAG TPA: NAD(P)H-binding protein, partial [Afifellaceae bacterium]|nr:NAD(P)H-binding protein [Afifellaceae bacterium]